MDSKPTKNIKFMTLFSIKKFQMMLFAKHHTVAPQSLVQVIIAILKKDITAFKMAKLHLLVVPLSSQI